MYSQMGKRMAEEGSFKSNARLQSPFSHAQKNESAILPASMRSFLLAAAMARSSAIRFTGLQSPKVIACAKKFPSDPLERPIESLSLLVKTPLLAENFFRYQVRRLLSFP